MLRKGDTVVFSNRWDRSDLWGQTGVLRKDEFGDGSVWVNLKDGDTTSGYARDVYKVETKGDLDVYTIANLVANDGDHLDHQAWQRLVARLTPLTD